MVDQDISKTAALLSQQYLFRGLSKEDIDDVVARFIREEWEEGEVLISEGESGESFYVIFEGKVRVTRQEGRTERRLDDLGPGDYFGEEALLFVHPRSATITALGRLVTLRLDREDFNELLEDFPDMRLNLSATSESRHLAQRVHFNWLGEDEVIYLVARKHEFFLFLSLLLPICLGVGGIVVLALGVASSVLSLSGIEISAVILVLAVLWGIWNWVDWGNDYYIVTSQRVVWLERVIIFYYSRREAPMTQVLAVDVRSSFIGRILHYGDVEVRTFMGSIRMRNCSNPHRFAYYVESFQKRAKEQQKKEEAAIIERELRLQLGLDQPEPVPEKPPAQPPAAPPQPSKPKPKPGGWREKLETFLKTRYERNGVITYRKHLLVLLWKTWQPMLVFALILSGTIYLFTSGTLTLQAWMRELPFLTFLGLIHLGVFLWWGYNYLDWSNDIYQLTPEQILDIERKPLGEEIKKSAPLASILSLEHSREGIIQLIFNFGNVIMNVGETQFIFRGVTNPDDVHKDIADAIEALRRKKEQAEALRDRERMAEWFSTYNRQSQILEEQKKESDWDIFPG